MFRSNSLGRATKLLKSPFQQVANYIIPAKSQRKLIPVYPPVETKHVPVVDAFTQQQFAKLDPTGWKRKLISKKNEEVLRAGDIVRVTYTTKNIPTFLGQVIGVTRKGIDSSILLRNQITKLGVELRVKVYSPLVSRIDIIRRPAKYRPRNKHYYIRNKKFDVPDLEAELKKKRH